MNLRTLVTGCVAGCALASAYAPARADGVYRAPVVAAPIEPYIPVQTFAGFYLGGHVGGAWGELSSSNRYFGFANLATVAPFDAIFVPFRTGSQSGSNAFGGVQGGYNFQSGAWVYGIEIDVGGIGNMFKHRDDRVLAPDGLRYADIYTNGNGGFYGDVTGRLGYSWGAAMIYAKGGFAWFDPNLSGRAALASFTSSVPVVTAFNYNNDNHNVLTGWTVGGGVEYMFYPNLSLKVEYLHFDFNNDNNGSCCFDGINNFKFFSRDLTVDSVKVGFNYYFRPEPAPLK